MRRFAIIILAAAAVVAALLMAIPKFLHKKQKPLSNALPPGISLTDAAGRDNGVRFVDLNGDGSDDIVFSNSKRYGVFLFNPKENIKYDWRVGWNFVMREGVAGDANAIPPIVNENGVSTGVMFKDKSMCLPDGRRIAFAELMRQSGPPPRTPEESLKAMHVKPGFTVELVASEPMVQDPIFIDWGADGRMWVVEMADYPFHEDQGKTFPGRVKILEDTDHDGRYDKVTVFADNLTYPSGLAMWKNGVFLSTVPSVLFAEDTDSDGKADKFTPMLTGFKEGNAQHLLNGFCWGLDGWFYGANGENGTNLTEVKSSKEFDLTGRDLRFHPGSGEFQLQAGRTQCGRWRDDFGNWFGNWNSSCGWHYLVDERYIARNPQLAVRTLRRYLSADNRIFPVSKPLRFNFPDELGTLTSACNMMPYRDNLFGDEYTHSCFICEPANNLVHREVLEPDGISFTSHRAADERGIEFLSSEDVWSRFTMARTGPDGCLYVVDFYRIILEHPHWIPKLMLANIDVRAGSDKGRIYRIRPTGTERRAVPRLDKMSDEELVKALASPNGWTRDTAQRLLIERGTKPTIDPTFGSSAVQTQALWTMHTIGTLDAKTLLDAMNSTDGQVRTQAVRLAESLPEDRGIIDRLCGLVDDADPRVRFQLALTLGEFSDARVPDVLRAIAKHDKGNTDILIAILSSMPRHAEALKEDAKQWQAALKSASKSTDKPPPRIITNFNSDREKVVNQYASVGSLTGDASCGHALYTNICSACHRLKNEGNEIGPDLGTVAAKPTDQIVEAIFDPSRAVEGRYLTQTLTTNQGRDIIGLVMEETANSLTVRTAAGIEVILRSDISKRSSTTKSLMPEGLESLLTPQHVADIIAWLRTK